MLETHIKEDSLVHDQHSYSMEPPGLQYPKAKPEMLWDPSTRKWPSTVYRRWSTLSQVVLRPGWADPSWLFEAEFPHFSCSFKVPITSCQKFLLKCQSPFGPHLRLVIILPRAYAIPTFCHISSIVMESQRLHYILLQKRTSTLKPRGSGFFHSHKPELASNRRKAGTAPTRSGSLATQCPHTILFSGLT